MGLSKILLKRYPKLLDTMKRRHEIYNKQRLDLWEEEKKGNCLVICPGEKLPVGRIEHNAERLKEAYNIGRETAKAKIKEIRKCLDE